MHDKTSDTLFKDLQNLLLQALTLVMIVCLLMVNPIVKQASQNDMKPQGNMMVEATWGDSLNDDVDLWVKSPDDDKAVGYSRKNGKTFNELRDDLGLVNDSEHSNYEVAFSRGLPPGEYVVNLHWFRDRMHTGPVSVHIKVSILGNKGVMQGVEGLEGNFTLEEEGDEITCFRFQIDNDGHLVPNSVNHAFEPLRSGP